MPSIRPTKAQLVENLTEVARLYKWAITFQPSAALPFALPAGVTDENLSFRCNSAMPPKREDGENIEVALYGHKFQIPGIYDDSHNVELTFIETTDNVVSLLLNAWKEALWGSNTGALNPNHKLDIVLDRLGNNDNSTVVWSYKCFGCWLMGYDPTGQELGGDTSDAVRPTATLYFDYFTEGPSTAPEITALA